MVPINYTSTKADPKWLYVTACILVVVTTIGLILQQLFPPPTPDLIRWRSLSEYQNEAERTNKPVLFVFTARWCGPCRQMEKQAFGDKRLTNMINEKYIPVLVMDEKRETGKNPPAIEKLQKTCAVEGFPTLIVVPANLLDGTSKDIYSTGSRAEYDLVLKILWPDFFEQDDELKKSFAERFQEDYLETYHDRVPAMSGYGGKDKIENYFWTCKIWHKLKLSRGNIAWQSMEKIGSGSKPTLIALVEDAGYTSDKMRLGLFESPEAAKLINNDFSPVLLEFKRGQMAKNDPKLLAIRDKYKIKALPALIILTPGKPPAVQDGFTSIEHTTQFLNRSLPNKN